MKNLILTIGTLFIALNVLTWCILTNYSTLNFVLTNLCIAFSMGIIYVVANCKLAAGFKIGLTVIFILTGIIRFLCVLFAPAVLKNNLFIIIAASVLLIETACLTSTFFVSRK